MEVWHHLFKGSKVSCYKTSTLLRQQNVQIYEVWHDLFPAIPLLGKRQHSRHKAEHSGVTYCYFLPFICIQHCSFNSSSSSCLPLLVIPTSVSNLSRDYRRKRRINNNPLSQPSVFLLHCGAHFQAILND